MSIIYYTAEDFTTVLYNGFDYSVSQEIIDQIQQLSDKVGAPEYVKTPQFITKNKRKNKNNEITDEDWDHIRTFEKTNIAAPKTNLDICMDKIRKNLNKISTKNYDILKDQIFNDLKEYLEDEDPNDNVIDSLNPLGEAIYEIASSNLFYSEMYAELYCDLMKQFPFFKKIFEENFKKIGEIFTNISYVNPDQNYEEFCNINKINEKRRALSKFNINLMKLNIIEKEKILKIIKSLQKLFRDQLDIPDKKYILDELSEVLYILVVEGNPYLNNEKEWNTIISEIKIISQKKAIDHISLTNKAIFKHMDINDRL